MGMSSEEGYRLAAFQRPGVKIIMGAESFREEPVIRQRMLFREWDALPGDASWRDHDMRIRLGYVPTCWAYGQARAMSDAAGRDLTDEEWHWLGSKSAGLANVDAWIAALQS